MKLTLRPEWRIWPLSSFLGLLDIKTGVVVALLFALLNKVAGIYGLIAVLTGAGGSFAQLSLYIYSAIGLVALGWGLKAVKEENAKQTLYFAHLFFADHIFSTAWTLFFAVIWWVYTPHDGRRQANSAAQKAMMEGASTGGHIMTDSEREAAALMIWNQEKGTAAAVIVVSWLCKIYFALLLYSYATHLRKGSYRSLPHTRSISAASSHIPYDSSLLADDEDEEVADFYRVPLRTPKTVNSTSSFTDFISAPRRHRKANPSITLGRSLLSKHHSGADSAILDDFADEVLFDDDEQMSSRSHSKFGTDDSATSVSSQDDDQTSPNLARIRS